MKTKIITKHPNILCASMIMLFMAFAPLLKAATITTAGGGGDWSLTSTWNGGVVPGSGDDVQIQGGDQVNVDMNVTINSLVINSNGGNNSHAFLTFLSGGYQFTVTGPVTLGNNGANKATGTLDMQQGGTLTANSLVEGSNNTSTFVATTAGTIIIKTASTLGYFNNPYNDVTIDAGAGTVSLAKNTDIAGTLLINTGTLDANNKKLTLEGDFTNFGGYTPGSVDMVMDGTANQNFDGSSGGYAIGGLNITNTVGVTLKVPVIIGGTLTLGGGILAIGNNNLTISSTGNIAAVAFSSTRFIRTNGSGSLEMTISHVANNKANSLLFPIGFSSLEPIFINPSSGTETFDAKINHTLTDKYGNAGPVATDDVGNNWTIALTSGSDNVIVTPQWPLNDETNFFNRDNSYVASRTSTVGNSPGAVWVPSQSAGTQAGQTSNPYFRTSGSISVTAGTPTYIAVGDGASALPVTLVSFNAAYENNVVNLNWATASEISNHYFNVQRSVDGLIWVNVAQVEGHGNSISTQNYFSTDDLAGVVPNGTFYYRLEQVDFNGSTTYSMIRSVTIGNVPATVNAFPNPAVNTLNVSWTSANEGTLLRIVNIAGTTVYTENVSGLGVMHKQIDVTAFPTGTYILQIANDNKLTSIPVLKN